MLPQPAPSGKPATGLDVPTTLGNFGQNPGRGEGRERLTGGPQPPSQGCGGGLPEALRKTDLLILLQKFARYYLTKKPQAPAQELETKAELLGADEKNGIPVRPQQAGPTLDLDPEKELELEEPQKPGKPSVFVVFRKVRCLFEGSAKR